jgi:hypothetical protein
MTSSFDSSSSLFELSSSIASIFFLNGLGSSTSGLIFLLNGLGDGYSSFEPALFKLFRNPPTTLPSLMSF